MNYTLGAPGPGCTCYEHVGGDTKPSEIQLRGTQQHLWVRGGSGVGELKRGKNNRFLGVAYLLWVGAVGTGDTWLNNPGSHLLSTAYRSFV